MSRILYHYPMFLCTLFIDFEIVYEVIFEVFEAEGCQWVKKQIFSVFSFKYKDFASAFFCFLWANRVNLTQGLMCWNGNNVG